MAIPIIVDVGEEMGDAVLAKLTKQLGIMKIGPGSDNKNDVEPLVTSQHCEKVKSYIDLGIEEGAELVVDGLNIVVKDHEEGFFLRGCLFDRVTPGMKFIQIRFLGPYLMLSGFRQVEKERVQDEFSKMFLLNESSFSLK